MSARAALLLLPVIYLGFISLGLPDGTMGVAWPQMHGALGLPIGLAGTLLLVVTLLSGVSSFSSGVIIARFRTGPVVLASCAMTGSALLIVSQAQGLAWLIAAAVPLGFGAGAVDSGLNGYVARHYSGRHMNWLHACWGVGATAGPFIMAQAIGAAGGWRTGYRVIAATQLSLAVVFLATLRLWSAVPERPFGSHGGSSAGAAPKLAANSEAGWLSPVLFAVYCAVEGATGLWASSILVVDRGLSGTAAGVCTTVYYGAITGGRILVGCVVDRWGARRIIAIGLPVALAGALLFSRAGSVPTAAAALLLTGLGFAPVYPCLMHEVPRRFAAAAVQTIIGRQSGAAYIGGAALPAVCGWVAQTFSLAAIPWVLAAGVAVLIVGVRRLDRIS